MTQKKSASSTSSEDRLYIDEPLTQQDPDHPATCSDPDDPATCSDPDDPAICSDDQQKSPTVKSTSKSLSKQKPASVNSIFTLEELTSDDEVFTLQCPEKFNKQDLCNKNLDFSQLETTITSKNEIYQLEFITSEKKSISLAIPKKTSGSSLVNLPLQGHIVIKKVVDLPNNESRVEDRHSPDKCAVVFPTNIKVRHPLLGTDWKVHTELVAKKINRKKLSKKHEKDKSLEITKENRKLKRESSEPQTPHKKKKKHDL